MSNYRGRNNFSVTSGRDGTRSFRGEHDDRWMPSSRGSWRSRGKPRGQNRGRGRGYKNFSSSSYRYNRHNPDFDTEGDVSMSGDNESRGHNRFSSRGPRGKGKRGQFNRRVMSKGGAPAQERWYKVEVPFGSEIQKDELFQLINSALDTPLEMFHYHNYNKNSSFYVKGSESQEKLKSINRRLKKPNGRILTFNISMSELPKLLLNENMISDLKIRMSERYDPSTQILSLSSLSSDDVLRAKNIEVQLNRSESMSVVTQIIAENIPELSGIDFSGNKLLSLGHLIQLVRSTQKLKSLNLANNQIRSFDDLDKLKGWKEMTELVLEGNELCNNMSKLSYESAVRKRFPKIKKLDGKDITPVAVFDLETNLSLPPSQVNYLGGNDQVKDLVITFIKEYFTVFDSGNRKNLLPAYHDKAQLSIFTARNMAVTNEKQQSFATFYDDARNLQRIGHWDSEKLAKRTKLGSLAVTSFLESFPKTVHDLNTFKVDVSLATPTLLSFVLQGLYKEGENSHRPSIRAFSRTFITIPQGAGMVIVNDVIMLTNPSQALAKTFNKESQAPTPSPSPVPPEQNTPSTSTAGEWMTDEHKALAHRFMSESGMTLDYSLMCLKQNSWDYTKAAQNFSELNSQGKIPPDAFVKSI